MSDTDAQEVLHLLTRRRFLAASAAFAATPLISWKALALSQAPYTFTQGDFEVTVISDGELSLPISAFLPDATPEQQAEFAKRLGWTPPNASGKANHAVLRKGDDIILVDTGSGTKFQPTAGKLLENLKAAGIDPATVTKVVLTHGHPDHVWGTTDASGAFYFPNAAYYVGRGRMEFLDGSRPHRQDAARDGGFRQRRSARVRGRQGQGDDDQAGRRRRLRHPGA